MERIELDELGPGRVISDLTPEEARRLRDAASCLQVQWRGPTRAIVRPDGFVGGLRLSERRAIAVTTKVPIANLLGLACLAYRSVPLPQSMGVTDLSVDRPLDWLAYLAVLEIESLVAHGLRQGYVEVEEEIPYIRGRIRFTGGTAVRARPALVPCAFADFRVDTPENQILRSTLERLRTMRLPDGLRARADEAARALDAVRIVPLSAALWTRVRATRVNQHYGPAIELCRLIDDSLGVEAGGGAVEARAFFFPMARVFEAAVANHLRRRVPGVRAQCGRTLAPPVGSPSLGFRYVPDVVIGDPPRLVLDTKYATAMSQGMHGLSWKHANAYQIAFYAHALRCPGVLAYVRDDRTGDVETTFEVAGREFTMLTVDLATPGLPGLERLAEWVQKRLESSSLPTTLPR